MKKKLIGSACGYDFTPESDFGGLYTCAGHELEMPSDRDMRVLVLTDLHITFLFNGSTYLHMDKLVKRVKPDLILLLDDNVGFLCNHRSQKDLIKKMDSHKIPWAPVLGNHDEEGRADRNYLAKMFAESKHGLFLYGPNSLPEHSGNYFINLMSGGKAVYTLYMMSSAKQYGNSITDYPPLPAEQVAWYKWAVLGNKNIPSAIFIHQPLKEFEFAWDSGEILYGSKREDVFSIDDTSAFFNAVTNLKSTKHIIAGHDHKNDYAAVYKGIQMTYALHSSKSIYRLEFWSRKKYACGATLFTVRHNGSATPKHIYTKGSIK